MKTLTVNNNGATTQIRIHSDGKFWIEGIEGFFILEEKSVSGNKVFDVIGPLAIEVKNDHGHSVPHVDITKGDRYRGYPLTSWAKLKTVVRFSELGITREHSNPRVAFALLAQTIL